MSGLLAECSGSVHPSRQKLAASLRSLADRVAGLRWIERDDAKGHRWVVDATDANGDTWAWQIVEFQGPGIPLYRVQVLDPDGRMLRWKKQPKTLKEAQKFAEAWARSASSGASLLMQNDFVRIAGLAPAPWETGPSAGPTMMKFRDERAAEAEALKRGHYYGFSVFSDGWYVGEHDKLKAIGVVDPKLAVSAPVDSIRVLLPTRVPVAQFDSAQKRVLVDAILRALAFYRPKFRGREKEAVESLFLDEF